MSLPEYLEPWSEILGNSWPTAAGSVPTKAAVQEALGLGVTPGTKVGLAWVMFKRPEGATRNEVVAACGGPQQNSATEASKKGQLEFAVKPRGGGDSAYFIGPIGSQPGGPDAIPVGRQSPTPLNNQHQGLISVVRAYVRDFLSSPRGQRVLAQRRATEQGENAHHLKADRDIVASRDLAVVTQKEGDNERLRGQLENSEPPVGGQITKHESLHDTSATRVTANNLQIVDLVNSSNVSVRLRNCILQADRLGEMPVRTVGAYLAGLPETQQKFLSLQNFGQKCAWELTSLINEWDKAASSASDPIQLGKPLSASNGKPADEITALKARLCQVFRHVKFPECILSGSASVRLRRALDAFEQVNGRECYSLALFLEQHAEWMSRLDQQKNFGRKTQKELLATIERIVGRLLGMTDLATSDVNRITAFLIDSEGVPGPISLTDEQWQILDRFREEFAQHVGMASVEEGVDDVIKALAQEPEMAMREFLQQHLKERDFDVLNRRFGIDRTRHQTLAEIAEGYGVTRERIRQIEVKAIRKCRVPAYAGVFAKFLEAQKNEILSTIADGGSFVSLDDAAGWKKTVTGLQRIAVTILYDDIESWLDSSFEHASCDDQRVGWFKPNIDPAKREQLEEWVKGGAAESSSLRQRIKNTVYQARWPITLSYFHENLPDVSTERLMKCLRNDFDAELENGAITAIKRLPSSIRLIIVLRDAGRSLHVSEIRARHNKLFGFDIQEHAASAVLQRLEEALIVGRGTYDLYENLTLSGSAVQSVRDVSFAHLRDNGHYLSAKILRRYLVQHLPQDISSRITAHMLLGICQDDSRFATRRGLMIGLAQEGFEETFNSLTETIHDVVRKHGPVSIADIHKHISHQRDVLDGTINMVLQSSPEIVTSERGYYDVVEHVIGDDTQIELLSQAIQIALIDHSISLPILMSRLAAVGYSHNSATVVSFLRNAGFVSRSGQVFQLTSPDLIVAEYNKKFGEIYDFSKGRTFNQRTLTEALQNHDTHTLIPLDFRLAMDPTAWNNVQVISKAETDFLDELMSEFEF